MSPIFGGDLNKITACVAAIAALIATPAFAADPVYSWTGWYVGVNAGASFGTVKTDFNAPVTAQTSTVIVEDVLPPVLLASGSAGFTAPFAGTTTGYPASFIGGGQIGYNWQLSPIWVVGLEADIQGDDERDSNTSASNFSGRVIVRVTPPSGIGGFTFPSDTTGSTSLNYQTKIDWLGTVRGRIGYVWGNGAVMSYVTGGLAYGKVDLEGTSTIGGAFSQAALGCLFGCNSVSVTQAFGHSQVNTGWTVGFGTEGKLLIPGWTLKVEGLYVDLGTLDATARVSGASSVSPPNQSGGGETLTTTGTLTAPVSTHSHFTDSILRIGLNYQFH